VALGDESWRRVGELVGCYRWGVDADQVLCWAGNGGWL
jgi:hypothetical protein